MVNIVISAIHFPLTMARYFTNAFKRQSDVKVILVGPFTGTWIPWNGGIHLDARYVFTPEIPLPRDCIGQRVPAQFIVNQLNETPDIWIDIDAGWRVLGRPNIPNLVYVQVQTDPHVLKAQYNEAKRFNHYDLVYCMQGPYMEADETYLPYAFDPVIHYPEKLEKEYDVCLIGLNYENRANLLSRLRGMGLRVRAGIGIVYDEYRQEYNKSKIALSWSSMQDLPARVWEAMGMRIPLVTNIVSDLDKFFVGGYHYLGFHTTEQAVTAVQSLLDNPVLADNMADRAYNAVRDAHTWDIRVRKILEDCHGD